MAFQLGEDIEAEIKTVFTNENEHPPTETTNSIQEKLKKSKKIDN